MIVTAHQPTYLPGVSVLAKVARADAVIWLDDVRFTTPGYVNRNQLPDGTWLTIPVERPSHRSRIREVLIRGSDWQREHVRELVLHYAEPGDNADTQTIALIGKARDGDRLADLNVAINGRLLALAGLAPAQHLQSDFPRTTGASLSEKMARMVREIGGTVYVSGPSGRRLLDPKTFARHGVTLGFYSFSGENPSAVHSLFRDGHLPTPGPESHREAVLQS